MNKLADYYGTRILVADENKNYIVDKSGHLFKIETEEIIFIKDVRADVIDRNHIHMKFVVFRKK